MGKSRVKNVMQVVIDGKQFSSRTEAFYYTLLKSQCELGEIAGFRMQVPYLLQPQFRKCSRAGCDFVWEKPEDTSPDFPRYKKARQCPECEHMLELFHSLTYVSDFDVTNLDGSVSVIDVKSSKFFQTEIFKLKKKLFEFRYPGKRLEMVFPKLPKGWGKEFIVIKEETIKND